MSSPIPVREADVLKAALDYLAAKRIFHMRLNSGAFVFGEGKSRRFFRAARPGCADVLAITSGHGFHTIFTQTVFPVPAGGFEHKPVTITSKTITTGVYWLECKTESGRQSKEQKAFQAEVEEQGMRYHIIRSIEDLKTIGL